MSTRERWEDLTQARWDADCALFGLKPEHYGAEVTCGRQRVQMLGIRPSARRYPVVTRDLRTNKRYDFPDMCIRKALKMLSAQEAEEEDRACWNRWSMEHGLSPEDFGRTFVHRGASYKVCGISPTAIKYHVIGKKTPHGSTYYFQTDLIRRYFRSAEDAAKTAEDTAEGDADDADATEEGEGDGDLNPMTMEQKRKLCYDLLRDLDDDSDWRTLQTIHSLTKKCKRA